MHILRNNNCYKFRDELICNITILPGPETEKMEPKSDSRSWSLILGKSLSAFSSAPAYICEVNTLTVTRARDVNTICYYV